MLAPLAVAPLVLAPLAVATALLTPAPEALGGDCSCIRYASNWRWLGIELVMLPESSRNSMTTSPSAASSRNDGLTYGWDVATGAATAG